MKKRYKITVEALESEEKVSFETENHDDLFSIFKRSEGSTQFQTDERLSLLLGLKLFSEVMLKRKDFTPFDVLKPVFGDFMKAFKEQMGKSPS